MEREEREEEEREEGEGGDTLCLVRSVLAQWTDC